MQLSRRYFLGSMASALAAARFRAYALGTGVPRLRFGVVSDIHVSHPGRPRDTYQYGSGTTFRNTLKWFGEQGVDAVLCPGDMADRGLYANLAVVADIWRDVFPGNRRADGGSVEPVFLYGNHDAEFSWFKHCSGQLRKAKTPEERQRLLDTCIARTRAESWRKAFGEAYADVYMKTVKGYRFICAHWGCEDQVPAFVAAHRAELAGDKPFFYAQHPHLNGTVFCRSKKEVGRDKGHATRALSEFPNAVAFSGHSHMPLALAQNVWQGAFTSIGASTLSYLETLSRGCLNEKPAFSWKQAKKAPEPFMTPARDRSREAMLVSVYDDRLEIRFRECVLGEELRAPRTLALPYDPRTAYYGYANQAKRLPPPAFPAGAAVTRAEKAAPDGTAYTVLEFPSAVCTDDSARVPWYDLAVFAEGSAAPVYTARVGAVDFFAPPARLPKTAAFAFPSAKLPAGAKLRYEIRARDFFERVSAPLAGTLA